MNKFEWIAAKIILGSCIIIAFIVLIAGIVNIVIKSLMAF